MNPILREKLWSVAKGAAVAASGAALTYAAQAVSVLAGTGEFGLYTPLVVAVLSVAVNAARKYLEPAPVVVRDDDNPFLPFGA